MTLRDALRHRNLGVPALPERLKTLELLTRLNHLPPGEARPTEDLDAVSARFLSDVRASRRPSVKDWNRIAWCLWTTSPAIADDQTGLDRVLGRVAEMRRKSPFRQLASVYLAEYSPDRPNLDRIAAVLGAFADPAGDPWRTLQNRYGIFDPVSGPVALARAALAEKMSVGGLLERLGVGIAAAEAGLPEAAYVAGLLLIRKTVPRSATERIDMIERWCLRSDRTLILPQFKAEAARAIIHPLVDQPLVEEDIRLLSTFLVDHFGDPRVNPANWIGMEDVADILRRWLVKASLRQFFDVVDRVAKPQQWQYRRAFWSAVEESGVIRDAYVVFDPAGAREAERAFRGEARFGRLRGHDGPVQEGHSVLLMKIGNAVVADWSHNGRCNIWDNNEERGAPHLHCDAYGRGDLRKALGQTLTEKQLNRRGAYTHSGAEGGLWQWRVAEHLYRLTGIQIPRSAYTVS